MNENENLNLTPGDEDETYSLEDILAEFRSGPAPVPPEAEASISPAPPLVFGPRDEDSPFGEAHISSADELLMGISEDFGEEEEESPPPPDPEPEPEPEKKGTLSSRLAEVRAFLDGYRDGEDAQYAGAGDYGEEKAPSPADETAAEEPESEDEAADEGEITPEEDVPPGETVLEDEGPSGLQTLWERISAPLVAVLAMAASKKQKQAAVQEELPPVEEVLPPEPSPARAARFYGAQVKALSLRVYLAAGFSLILLIFTLMSGFGAEMPGAMAENPRVTALFFLILLLCTVMAGLDVFTNGLLSLARLEFSMEGLTALSCVFSAFDAVLIAAGAGGDRTPYCAVSAASLTFALCAGLLTCSAYRTSFATLARGKALYTVTAETGVDADRIALLRSRRAPEGFIRRSEEPDLAEDLCSVMVPFLIAAALILAFTATVLRGRAEFFLHVLSGALAAGAAFPALLAFPLPFAITAKRLTFMNTAIAGFAGCRDIGRSKRLILTDADLFPAGTVSIAGIRILEGVKAPEVIAGAGSVICASGSGLAAVFAELMRKNAGILRQVTDFTAHDGGGLTAVVEGRHILVGSSGFMNLMGIRLPQKLNSKTAVYVAFGENLVGIFSMKYVPVVSVQRVLSLMRVRRREPLFAVRDFNITPLLVRQLFRINADGFDFPSYPDRFRISSAEPGEHSRVSAVLSREGLAPLGQVADLGRRLYRSAQFSTATALAWALAGIGLIFIFFYTGLFVLASAAALLLFMLAGFVICLFLSLGQLL